jgi:hypothetical protein
MFDDAKYMAKEAVDRNNALGALDQMREEKSTPRWAKSLPIRRLFAVVVALLIVVAPLITAMENPRWFVAYLIVVVLLIGLARSATRASLSAIGRIDITVVAALSFLSVLVALSARTDTNLQAGVTATAGIAVSVIAAAIAASPLTRLFRPATS